MAIDNFPCRFCAQNQGSMTFHKTKAKLRQHLIDRHKFTEKNAQAIIDGRLDDVTMFDIDPPKKEAP